LAISCECWNSAQSTLIYRAGVAKRISAAASTMRVLPEPVGPRTAGCNGAAGRVQSGAKNLEHVHEGLHALFLADDLCPQRRVKITRIAASYGWIQLMADGCFHFINLSSRLAPPNA